MSVTSSLEHSNPERLHGGWVEQKALEKNKWNPVWCVLKRDGTLFFFTSQETSLDTHIGTLHITKESIFQCGTGDPVDGYRFELHIHKKKKKFRVKKPYDRELWRAYMVAVITGSVPQDGNLSAQDLQTIINKMHPQQQQQQQRQSTSTAFSIYTGKGGGQNPSFPSSTPTPTLKSSFSSSSMANMDDGSSSCRSGLGRRDRRDSLPSIGTGSGTSEGSFDPTFSMTDVFEQISADSGVSDNTGGPFMHHKFDIAGVRGAPSWFFEDCNRQLAEKILEDRPDMGNTLMRVSSSARPCGSYVISKKLESQDMIVHYEVIRVADGYRINAQNVTKTMRTLSEVMDFFIELSGAATTHPLRSNDLEILGVHVYPYNRGPILPHVGPSANDLASQENYEVPQQQNPRKVEAAVSATSPPPPPPPGPGPAPTPPAMSFNTWGKDKTGPLKWQTKENCPGSAAKTLGHADERRQIKPPDSSTSKTSVMQVNRSLEEHHAVANLDNVIRDAEAKWLRKAGQEDGRPPLPAVPHDRPRLNSAIAGDSCYMNLPVTQVPANVGPPSLVKPGAGGRGKGKVPPPTAPKTRRGNLQAIGIPKDSLEKAVGRLMPELEEKLHKMRMKNEEREHQLSPTTTKTTTTTSKENNSSRPLPPIPPASLSPAHDAAEDDEEYDYVRYQNVPSVRGH